MLKHAVFCIRRCRRFATVFPSIIIQPPPPPPAFKAGNSQGSEKTIGESLLDSKCLAALSKHANQTSLTTLIKQYVQTAGCVLDRLNLPYESRPKENKVLAKDSKDIVLVAHCASDDAEDRVTLSSGFVLNARMHGADESLILTCAHTLEEVRYL